MLGGASDPRDRIAGTAAKGDRIMTVVGKILVFLNLVFSLVVGAFAVMDYTARTHWVDGFKTLEARYQVLEGVTKTYKDEADRLAKDKDDHFEKLNKSGVKGLEPGNKLEGLQAAERAIALLNEQAKTIAAMRTENENLRTERADAKGKLSQYRAIEIAQGKDVSQRQNDSSILRTQLAAETTKNFDLTKNTIEMRDAMVQAQIQAGTLKDRNSQLEAQLQDVARDLLRSKAAPGGAARGGNPPPENLEGVVRRADGNYVTVSLGSDAGLTKGNTLEVFRLGTNPKYIGKIRIVDVTPTQSVGQVIGRMSVPIQVDDRVASRILGGP